MAEMHPFTVEVRSHLIQTGRFRWIILNGGRTRRLSVVPFLTRKKAEEDAETVLQQMIAEWQLTK